MIVSQLQPATRSFKLPLWFSSHPDNAAIIISIPLLTIANSEKIKRMPALYAEVVQQTAREEDNYG